MTEPTAPDAEALAASIRGVAEKAHTEEDVRVGVERLLAPILGQLGVTYTPTYERHYRTALLKGGSGRSDAVYGHAIIEYEPPGTLRTDRAVKHAQGQLERYLKAEASLSTANTDDVLRRSVGIALDGLHIFFVRYRGRGVHDEEDQPLLLETQLSFLAIPQAKGPFRLEGPYEVATDSIAQFLVYLRALRRRELTPERLADSFGPKGDVAHHVVGALLQAFKKSDDKRVKTLYSEWDRIFGIVYGQEVSKAVRDAHELARLYAAPPRSDLKPLLFAVHTYFALIMKLLAAELVSLQGGYLLARPIADLPSLPSDELHRWLRDLEDGGLFARQGVHNFLEGDFFGWYLSAWNAELEAAIREMARTLSEYEPATGSLLPEATRDLLKKLYQYLIPREIRHDLGEYYTPDWLAELVLDEVEYKGQSKLRVLDPACGSGTFLVLAIRRAREAAEDRLDEPNVTAEQILSNVTGFDLNPLAVIAARTNYLLALGTLVRHKRPLEIPVYLCDSILTPSTYDAQKERTFEAWGEPYVVPSVVGDFRIPRDFATKERLEGLMRVLEECTIVPGHDAHSFLERVAREVGSADEGSYRILEALFAQVVALEEEGRNGIWARLLKNRFAPLFVGKVDLVVGNPPWVNWSSLADHYREATAPLWQKYKLFPHTGLRARLGSALDDLSILMTYTAMDTYLKDKGKLGFVMTQTVFKSKGGGQGFRRFRLGDETYLRVLGVNDLTELRPFEGASNRTSTIVLEKAEKTEYPVPYVLWRKLKPGRIRADLSPLEVEGRTSKTHLHAQPVDTGDLTSPWLVCSLAASAVLKKVRGQSPYSARVGAYAGVNGVYWLRIIDRHPGGVLVENLNDVGRTEVRNIQALVEPDLVYPLLRGRDVRRWACRPSAHVLMPQRPDRPSIAFDESALRVDYPHAYAYLKTFEAVLRQRAAYRKYFDVRKTPFYSMYDVGDYTFAPYKVLWREQAADLTAAVPETTDRPVIPDHKLMLVECESVSESHYLCAVLNSAPARLLVRSYTIDTQTSTHVLSHVAIPRFKRANATHRALSRLSLEAHELASEGTEGTSRLREAEGEIDKLAARLWGITDAELEEIRRSLADY